MCKINIAKQTSKLTVPSAIYLADNMFKKKVELEKYNQDIDYLKRVILQQEADLKTKLDSLYYNYLTKQGTSADTNEYTRVKEFWQFSIMELENLYSTDTIIKRIVQTRTKYVFKDGFSFETSDEDYERKFKELFYKKYKIWDKMKSAYLSGLIHGHTFLLLRVNNSGDYDIPIQPSDIKTLDNISVINRYFLAAYPQEMDYEFNPSHYYTINQPLQDYNFDLSTPIGVQDYKNRIPQMGIDKIHKTHLLGFIGSKLMPYTFRNNLHFHDSYIRSIMNSAKNYNIIMDSISTILSKMPYPIYKIEGLSNKLTNPAQRNQLAQAMAAKEQVRSQFNISAIDTKEEYELYTPNFSGISELIQQAKERVCLDCDITHDILFNEGSIGQTTGRTEKTTFQSVIEYEQQEQVKPKIEFFMEVFENTDGLKIPKDVQLKFDHHESPSQKEETEIFTSFAQGVSALESHGYDCSLLVSEKYPQIEPDEDFDELEAPVLSAPQSKEEKPKNDKPADKKKKAG